MGIGLAIAEALAAEGVNLVLAARDAGRPRDVATRIATDHEVKVHSVAADLGTAAADVIAACAAAGGIDILVNNGGTGSNETILQAPVDKWQAY